MPNVVKVYNYNSEGKITATGTMDLDVFEVVPIDATIIQPPKEESELEADELLSFDETNDEWILEIDPNYEPPAEPEVSTTTPHSERIDDLELALADIIAGGM